MPFINYYILCYTGIFIGTMTIPLVCPITVIPLQIHPTLTKPSRKRRLMNRLLALHSTFRKIGYQRLPI